MNEEPKGKREIDTVGSELIERLGVPGPLDEYIHSPVDGVHQKIISVIPAQNGWWAVYRGSESRRVVAWALVETMNTGEDEETFGKKNKGLVPMVPTDGGYGFEDVLLAYEVGDFDYSSYDPDEKEITKQEVLEWLAKNVDA